MGNLQKDIKELIDQSIEGPYWDFKQKWYSKEKLINELENEPYIRNPNSFSGSRASDPAYIDFLCKCGKILNEWLNVWRLKK